MVSRIISVCIGVPLLLGVVYSQTSDDGLHLTFEMEHGSPVTLVSADLGQSRVFSRGGARVFEIQALLTFRNSEARHIRGISLVVAAGNHTPGSRGVVRSAVFDIPEGVAFPVPIELRLCRSVQEPDSAPVRVRLDGVLFDDLGFYGRDESGSRQWLTARESEAHAARLHLKTLLERYGIEALRSEVLSTVRHERLAATEGLRLADIYRTHGMRALIGELRRF